MKDFFILLGRSFTEKPTRHVSCQTDIVPKRQEGPNIVRRILPLSLTILVLLPLLPCGVNPWVGQPAPDFTATDLNGNQISLTAYRGKVVLLDFWATWCAGCLMEMPDVKQAYEKYKNRDFVVIGVSLDVNQVETEKFVRKRAFDWPQIFDGRGWGSEVGQIYHVDAIPATFLIDKKGIIRYTDLDGSDFDRAIERLLKAT